MSDEGLLTVKEVAAYLKLKPRTVSDMAKDGRLSARRVAGEWRFDPADVRVYDERQQPPSEAQSRPVSLETGGRLCMEQAPQEESIAQ